MTPTRMLLLAPVLAVALAGAGCGGSDQNEFIDGYNAATAPLTQLTSDLSGTPDQDSLDKMADGLEDVQAKLGELEPPDGAQDELDAMLASLEQNTAQVRKLAKAVKSGDVEQLSAATQSFSAEGAKLVAAEQALRTAVDG